LPAAKKKKLRQICLPLRQLLPLNQRLLQLRQRQRLLLTPVLFLLQQQNLLRQLLNLPPHQLRQLKRQLQHQLQPSNPLA
jgi:hypothetical protein